jgi:hypothetical protein
MSKVPLTLIGSPLPRYVCATELMRPRCFETSRDCTCCDRMMSVLSSLTAMSMLPAHSSTVGARPK